MMVQRRLVIVRQTRPRTTLAEDCEEQDPRPPIHPDGALLLVGAMFAQALEALSYGCPHAQEWFDNGGARYWCDLAGLDWDAVARRVEEVSGGK